MSRNKKQILFCSSKKNILQKNTDVIKHIAWTLSNFQIQDRNDCH